MAVAAPTPRKKFEELFLIEEAALAHLHRAELLGASIKGSRIGLTFEMNPGAIEALAVFRNGNGPKGDLAKFNQALRWARDRIFDARRRGGLDGDGR